ncbi:hypothetical protein HPB47_002463 [Ixodes persulcatus]|uniref:Uncharacterized protein n=1 Tax=Ixodes persulcatus TaxID=34615 RepID=A0AC60PL69_IXOPE|nr:hypothetical protein HPB47_002463 [Ixodes persulcatus]
MLRGMPGAGGLGGPWDKLMSKFYRHQQQNSGSKENRSITYCTKYVNATRFTLAQYAECKFVCFFFRGSWRRQNAQL